MIKHIVCWNLKEENKLENAKKIKEALEGLRDKIEFLNHIEVGINVNSSDAAMDVCLYSEFDSLEDLNKYQVHEEHIKAGAIVKACATLRKVVDYEV